MSKQNSPRRPFATAGNSMGQAVPTTRRLNIRALVILSAVVVVGTSVFFILKAVLGQASQRTFLEQARKSVEDNRPDNALRFINEYLKINPSSLEALDLKSQVLGRDGSGLDEAIRVQGQILALDPSRKEARKRQIEFNLRAHLYRTAQVAAEEYLKLTDDAEAHRLMAQALEGVGYLGDTPALDRAIVEYETAEKMQPGDVRGGLRLARLYRTKGKNPKRALEIMDSLLKANPKSAEARLARFQFFLSEPDSPEKLPHAMAEIDEAIKLAPGDAEARLIAAELAAQRGETAEARRHLAAINPPPKNDLPIKLVTGLIELHEQRDEAAIESWRSGLIQSGGSDADLTWRLARLLLMRGRIREAEPLMSQYRRLVGGDEPNPEYRYLLALKLTKTGRAGEAIKELEAIRDKIDRNFMGQHLFALGTAYEMMRDETKALDAYRRSVLMADGGAPPWLAIARVQLSNQPAEAISTLERGLVTLPNEPSLLAALAQLLWQQEATKPKDRRNWAAFDRWLEKAEKASPKAPDVTIVRADYLATDGRLDESLNLIQSACARSPNTVSLWLARANLLGRLRRVDEALAVLAEATKVAGDNAPFRTTRSRLLLERGEAKAAREVLVEGLDRVPVEQKPIIWKAMGEYHQAQRDYIAARRSFEEWARLQPDSTEPHLALLNLAVVSNDVAAMEAQVDAMKAIGGTNSLFWKIARGEFLLQLKPKEIGDKAPEDKARLAEAEALIKEIKTMASQQPSSFLLEGRLLERNGHPVEAIAAYRQALDLRGGQIALRPLVILLARENRNDELEALHKKLGPFPPDIEKIAGAMKLQSGDAEEAERMARRFVQGDPQSLDATVWKARVLNTLGKPREAEEALKVLTRQRPDDPSPWLQLLMFQISQKKMDAATATIEAIKTQVKTDRPELLWATCYRVIGSRKQADEAYATALKRWPDDATVRRVAADYYEATGRIELTEQSLRHLLRVTPGLDWARRRLALIISARPNDPVAWTEAMSLVAEDPTGAESPDDRLHRAIVLARGPDPRNRDAAIKILETLAAEIPNSAKLNDVLARSLLSIGQKTKAREFAAKAAAGPEATVDSVLLYATLALDERDLDEAERQLTQLATMDPNALPTVELGARISHARGDDVKAVATLRRAFEEHKADPDVLVVGIGILKIMMDLKLFDAANTHGQELSTVGPKGKIAFAEFLGGRGKVDQALAMLDAAYKSGATADAIRSSLALATESADPAPWLGQTDKFLALALKDQTRSAELLPLLAYLRHLQRSYPEEIQLYQDILKTNPSNLLFLNNMAWTLSEEMGRPEDGLDRINQVLKRVGLQPHLLDTRGVILLRLGKVDEAIKDLETAVASLPSPPLFFHLARAYEKAGKKAESEKYRDLARQAGLKPEQLQPSERDEASKLVGFAKPAASSKP